VNHQVIRACVEAEADNSACNAQTGTRRLVMKPIAKFRGPRCRTLRGEEAYSRSEPNAVRMREAKHSQGLRAVLQHVPKTDVASVAKNAKTEKQYASTRAPMAKRRTMLGSKDTRNKKGDAHHNEKVPLHRECAENEDCEEVMLDAVQNHSAQVVVIDEIRDAGEVQASRTIANQGVISVARCRSSC
jgi:hypothetical protein